MILKNIYKLAMLTLLFLAIGFSTACGPKAFVKGTYDEDINRENNLNDNWSETDMQKVVADLVAAMIAHPTIANAKTAPYVMVTKLQNKTAEHIDTKNIMDMVRVELSRGGRVRFIDKEAREDIDEEYNYQNSGRVAEETKKGPGGQIGPDFIINGNLDSIRQAVGKDETVYYKVTLNLTNIKTSVIEWSDYKQLRKVYRKRSIGL